MESAAPLLACWICLSIAFSSASQVPVLVGSTNEVLAHQGSLRAGHVVSSADLPQIVAPFLSTELHCVVIFDNLKLSDFAVHGDVYSPDGHGSVFRHTKAFLEGTKSTLPLPSVDSMETSPEDVVRSMLRQSNPSLHVEHLTPSQPEEVKSLRFTTGKPTLWLVRLPAESSTDGRVASLRKSDAIVGALHQHLAQFEQYSFTLTSKHGEEVADETHGVKGIQSPTRRLLSVSEDVQQNGKKRCTLMCFSCQNQTSGGNACASPAVLLCYRNFSLTFEGVNVTLDTRENTTVVTAEQDVLGCVNDNVSKAERLGVSMTVSSTNSSISMRATLDFHFQLTKAFTASLNNTNGTYWELMTVAVRHSDGTKSGCRTLFPVDFDNWVYAPLKQSYNCLPSTRWTPANNFRQGNVSVYEQEFCSSSSDDSNITMIFEGIQVQAYEFTKQVGPYFDHAAECVHYFTGPAWMGIIVVSLFLFAIFMASLAFLATDTPDRFDDPKGKNIQVQ